MSDPLNSILSTSGPVEAGPMRREPVITSPQEGVAALSSNTLTPSTVQSTDEQLASLRQGLAAAVNTQPIEKAINDMDGALLKTPTPSSVTEEPSKIG